MRSIYARAVASPTRSSQVRRFGSSRVSFTRDGRIARVESISERSFSLQSSRKKFGCLIPGLIDPHTHLLFSGSRAEEWNQRLKGVTYQEIAKRGGGIRSTVLATQKASEQSLIRLGRQRLQESLSFGVTTIEAKTGYGLSEDSEFKLLRALHQLKSESAQQIFITLMAAHALPKGISEQDYVDQILRWIPAASLYCDFQDVFVEAGYFSKAAGIRLLTEGRRWGLLPRVHAHEFGRTGGVAVAAEVRALSADHLIHVSAHDLKLLKKANVIPVLLPGTCFFLGARNFSPARRMWDFGLKVALATDFNPGTNPTLNLPLMGTLAAIHQGLSLDEVLVAQTWHAALSLGLRDRGMVEKNYRADLVAIDADSFESIYYSYGRPTVEGVWISGKRVL